MSEPWFNPNLYAWIPGTVFGCLGGVWGGLAGVFAPRGKMRGLIMGLGFGLLAASVILLIAGASAWATGQPFGVYFGLLFPGIQVPMVLGPLLPVVRLRYRQAEERLMQAEDLG
jgi:hypothetical protein